MDLAQYSTRLEEMEESMRRLPQTVPIMVAGDFNAKSPVWGSPRQNRRGEVLIEWAAVLGLCVLNMGSRSTCVRPQGESIVDLTWVTPSAARLVRN